MITVSTGMKINEYLKNPRLTRRKMRVRNMAIIPSEEKESGYTITKT
jgi:hypothetical protein